MDLMWTHLHKYLGHTFYGGFFMVDLVKVEQISRVHHYLPSRAFMHEYFIMVVVVMWTQGHSSLGALV
jgi:hypothetical protein